MPIDELAASAGVSIATANRFARAIGLDGYPALRAELVSGFEEMLAPLEKLRIRLAQPVTTEDVFAAALEDCQRNIATTRSWLDVDSCRQAVERILAAERVYIVGFGASGWLGGLLQRGLDPYCRNVHLLSGMGGASYAARQLAGMTAGDLLIAMAFPRYVIDTVRIVEAAHGQGVPVLALTDGAQSPLVGHAQVCLYAQTESQYAASSDSAVLALIEALASAVAHHARGSVQVAARITESVMPWLVDDRPGRRLSPMQATVESVPERDGAKADVGSKRKARQAGVLKSSGREAWKASRQPENDIGENS